MISEKQKKEMYFRQDHTWYPIFHNQKKQLPVTAFPLRNGKHQQCQPDKPEREKLCHTKRLVEKENA